mmetsp:Transcript_70924/g.118770  ORF Transcript_70924/g.118770 Transcript_70924/m.118770 type:complete len:108 (+) Transcript_70924:182-505(+)
MVPKTPKETYCGAFIEKKEIMMNQNALMAAYAHVTLHPLLVGPAKCPNAHSACTVHNVPAKQRSRRLSAVMLYHIFSFSYLLVAHNIPPHHLRKRIPVTSACGQKTA